MRRVVVTGLGMVTPLGCGVDHTWQRLIAGQSGVTRVERFEVADLPARIAGQIPRGDGSAGTYNPDQWMEPKEQRKVDEFIVYAMCAAKQALDDAGWKPQSYDDQIVTGVLLGAGIGGAGGIADTGVVLKERGPRRVSPFFVPGRIINLASGYVSIEHGLKGPNHAVVTACSTGSHAIGDAGRLIALGDADVMVAGGTESPINRVSMAGFAAARALSTAFNDTPERASRPYDRDRDGFVMAEGAGAVVLEEYEHAKARGARIYAELIGYGLSGDAYHITAPSETGSGARRAASTSRPGRSCGRSPSDVFQRSNDPHDRSYESGRASRAANAVERVRQCAAESRDGAYCASEQRGRDCSGLGSHADVQRQAGRHDSARRSDDQRPR